MKLKQILIPGIAFLLLVGCSEVNSTNLTEPSSETSEMTSSSPATATNPSPDATVASNEVGVVKTGTFASGEHPTRGTVSIVEQDGQRLLQLGDDFETSSLGPDLVVILHRSSDVLGSTEPPAYPIEEGDYVFLSELQEFTGAQSYVIPEGVDIESYQSAAIWCRRFNATFGAAPLS